MRDIIQWEGIFLSTLSLRRATLAPKQNPTQKRISIHALLAESDALILTDAMLYAQFLSTLSLRRATAAFRQVVSPKLYFYPRSPCGERLTEIWDVIAVMTISIHALLAESDQIKQTRRAETSISIHALLAESDSGGHISKTGGKHFYPRSPCGERPASGTLSDTSDVISIHALLAESDRLAPCSRHYPMDFYPRSPCGERLNSAYGALDGASISIHALLAESDFRHCTTYLNCSRFLSTLSLRRATSMGLDGRFKL